MPLAPEVKALIGDAFTEDALAEMLTPEVQTRLGSTHVIRTKEDDESFVSSRAKELKDAEIGSHVGSLHQMYEDQIKEMGYQKKSNEKTSEFQKRVLADLKAQAAAGQGGDAVLKEQITALTASIETLKSEKESAVSELQTKYFKKQVDSLLSMDLAGRPIAVPATIKTDAEKQAYAENQRSLLKLHLLNNYTVKEDNDGNTLFYKGDVLEKSTQDGKPLTATDIISRDFAPYFDVQQQKSAGAGSSAGVNGGGTFSTMDEVYTHLKSNGFEEGTKRFTEEAMKIKKEQGIIK